MLLHRPYIFSTHLIFAAKPTVRPLSRPAEKTVTYRRKTVTYRKKTVTFRDVPRPREWPWKAQGDEVLQTLANLNQESSLEAESPY